MSATDVGVLATLVLVMLPALVGAAIFALLLSFEVPELIRNRNVGDALRLRLTAHAVDWSLDESKIPWPTIQLERAAAAAMLMIVLGLEFAIGDDSVRHAWFVTAAASSVLVFGCPFCLYLFCRRPILRLIRSEIASRLNSLTREENVFLRKMTRLGAHIAAMYSESDLNTQIQIEEISKHILIERATGKIANARPRFERAIATLRVFSEEVGEHLDSYRQVMRDFQFTKNLAIDRGSITLLGELDRIKTELTAQEIGFFFDGAQWVPLQTKLDQIAFDLSLIRNMAEGGNDLPLSLGQACQLLNVTTNTSIKSAKAVVDALRRVWHPDTGDHEEKERRTVKTTQINVAWEIFLAACDEKSTEAVSVKPQRLLEPA